MSKGALHSSGAALLALFLLWSQVASADEATLRITATWIINYVEPKPRSVLTRRSYFVTLKSDGTVKERLESVTGNKSSGRRSRELDKGLGEVGGERRFTTWKVVNETTLVRLVARESHTFVIWVKTQGKDACTATLEWRLKPGFTLYDVLKKRGKPQARFTEPSWPNARCDVL